MTSRRMEALNRKVRIVQLRREHPDWTHLQIAAEVGYCSRQYISSVIRQAAECTNSVRSAVEPLDSGEALK